MEPVRNDTTTDRRTAVELAKRLLVDLIWRTAKIEVDGVTFPDTQEIFDGRAPEGMSVDDSGLRVKMCVWLGVSRGLDLAFLNAD